MIFEENSFRITNYYRTMIMVGVLYSSFGIPTTEFPQISKYIPEIPEINLNANAIGNFVGDLEREIMNISGRF